MTSTARPDPAEEMTPLEERLLSLIADNGPMRVGDYMADALSHSQHGYYTTQDPFGTAGDFTTAPEISQLFGELVGAWLVDAWEGIGAPSYLNLVELGPGRGTLMADILRVAKLRPGFLDAARITLIENSGRMRVRQQRTLGSLTERVTWADSLDDVPEGPTLIVANEFFDCLPIRQFVRTAEKGDTPWRERLVGRNTGQGRDRLAFVLSEDAYEDRAGMPAGAAPESIFEESEAAQELIAAMAARFAAAKGRALIVDYGHGRSGFADTLQAVKNHRFVHPLAAPGLVDVTAHVDFGALARAGRTAGARIDGPVTQAHFLKSLGIEARLEQLRAAASTDEVRETLAAGAARLLDPAPRAMGSLFKVMAVSSAGLPGPPGF